MLQVQIETVLGRKAEFYPADFIVPHTSRGTVIACVCAEPVKELLYAYYAVSRVTYTVERF